MCTCTQRNSRPAFAHRCKPNFYSLAHLCERSVGTVAVHGVDTASRNRSGGKEWRHNSAAPTAWRSEGTSHAMARPPPFILRKTRWDLQAPAAPVALPHAAKCMRARSLAHALRVHLDCSARSVESMVDNPPWDSSNAVPLAMSGRGKMKTRSSLPAYDALSDPAMADYWARKFGCVMLCPFPHAVYRSFILLVCSRISVTLLWRC